MPTSRHPPNPQLKALRWRLLLSSLGVIGCTLAVFGFVVYQVVAHSLEQKSDRQLKILADAAAHSLPDIISTPKAAQTGDSRTIDDDGDLDIPWQNLRQEEQSIEWFDTQGQRLGRAGQVFPASPFAPPKSHFSRGKTARSSANKSNPNQKPADEGYPERHEDKTNEQDARTHWLIVPVYQADSGKKTLQGYVRVSESNEEVLEELSRLRSGLAWGSFGALLLSAIGGCWLTQQSLQPIDRSIRQLKQFTADASHELRNPLTAIRASVEVMQSHEERFHPSDVAKLESIASATIQMSQLVNDLLWLARSDQALTEEQPAILIPLNELLEEVLDQYMAQAEQKQITLKANFQADVSVQGNPWQLKRLFGNLITNALRYTPEAGTVTLLSDLEDHWAIVQVEDTGIGIAPDQIPLVFDRFWQADSAREHREGSSGLGLAIAQAIVEQHQGKISVQSTVGKGSCFQVELPKA